MKLSDYVVRFIAQQGVRHVFMLPGGGAMHLNDSLGRSRDVEFICNLHEQACSIAAEAYARVTRNLGVIMVTTGPGGTNAITGVAGAWLESTPVLIISGQVKRADMKRDLGVRQLGAQELDIVTIVKSITKYAVTVTDPNSVRYHLERAVHEAKSGRPGPVWIDIPLDVQAAQVDPSSMSRFELPKTDSRVESRQLAENIASAIQLLNRSERPLLLAGNGIHAAAAEDDFQRLVDYLQIPVLTTWMGTDLLPDDHPCFYGKPGTVAPRGPNFVVQNADLLISIGSRLDFPVTGYDQSKFAREAKKIVVDIDRAEITKLAMAVTLPIVSDVKAFLQEFWRQRDTVTNADRAGWHHRCKDWNLKYPVVPREETGNNDYVSSYSFGALLAEQLERNDLIIPGSSGAALDRFWLSFRVKAGQRLFSTGGLGAMGFGIPAAIGGCVASGLKRTVSIDGDGGIQLNIQELAVVARLKLPIKFFVLNNQGYASIRASQKNYFGQCMACDESTGLSLPDLVRIADGYDIAAMRISSQADLREGIRTALTNDGPILCDVMVNPEETTKPRVSSAVRADGTMVSRPLEDLWPFLEREELRANMIVAPLED